MRLISQRNANINIFLGLYTWFSFQNELMVLLRLLFMCESPLALEALMPMLQVQELLAVSRRVAI